MKSTELKNINKYNYFKVIFSKLALTLLIVFLPLSNQYLSKTGTIFLTYLALSIIYICFAISRNYIITLLLIPIIPLGFIYLGTLRSKEIISEKMYMYIPIILVFLPFIYDFYVIVSVAINKFSQRK